MVIHCYNGREGDLGASARSCSEGSALRLRAIPRALPSGSLGSEGSALWLPRPCSEGSALVLPLRGLHSPPQSPLITSRSAGFAGSAGTATVPSGQFPRAGCCPACGGTHPRFAPTASPGPRVAGEPCERGGRPDTGTGRGVAKAGAEACCMTTEATEQPCTGTRERDRENLFTVGTLIVHVCLWGWLLTKAIPCMCLPLAPGLPHVARHEQEQQLLDYALLRAVRDEKVTTVRNLLRAGANPNVRFRFTDPATRRLRAEEAPDTVLHRAASLGNVRIATMLLQRGANPNAPCQHGTPLMEAAAMGELEVVSLLLKFGADLTVDRGGYEGTALKVAEDARDDWLRAARAIQSRDRQRPATLFMRMVHRTEQIEAALRNAGATE